MCANHFCGSTSNSGVCPDIRYHDSSDWTESAHHVVKNLSYSKQCEWSGLTNVGMKEKDCNLAKGTSRRGLQSDLRTKPKQKCPNPLQQAQISSNNFFHLQRLEDNERLSANMINDRMRTYKRSSITTLYSLELLVQPPPCSRSYTFDLSSFFTSPLPSPPSTASLTRSYCSIAYSATSQSISAG